MTAASYGATLAIGFGLGWCAALAIYRAWRVNADVLSLVPEPAPEIPTAVMRRPLVTGSRR
jgi:hypothetical protein